MRGFLAAFISRVVCTYTAQASVGELGITVGSDRVSCPQTTEIDSRSIPAGVLAARMRRLLDRDETPIFLVTGKCNVVGG